MTCAICEKKLRAKHEILLRAGGIRWPSTEDLDKIICKLAHTDRIQLITSDDEIVQIKVRYHENNLRKFFEELNFEEAMCTVPKQGFLVTNHVRHYVKERSCSICCARRTF